MADCPVSHEEIDSVLHNLRETVGEINLATDDRSAQQRIQRTWLLQEKLVFPNNVSPLCTYESFADWGCSQASTSSQCRRLGHVALCGVLHVAYQTKARVHGDYMLCALFKAYLVLGIPRPHVNKFDVVAIIHLADLKVEIAEDSRGENSDTSVIRD